MLVMNKEKMGAVSRVTSEEKKILREYLSRPEIFGFRSKNDIVFWFENVEMFDLLSKMPFGVFIGDKAVDPRSYLFHVLDSYCRKNCIGAVVVTPQNMIYTNRMEYQKSEVLIINFSDLLSMLYSHFLDKGFNTKGLKLFAAENGFSLTYMINN